MSNKSKRAADKETREKTRKKVFVIAAFSVTAAVLVSMTINNISLSMRYSEKEEELKTLQAQYEAICDENDRLDAMLNDGDDKKAFEYYARNRGYIHPDEKVYLDSSSNQ